MVYNYKELKEKFGTDYKIESGIYSDKQNNHYLAIFTKKYPNAIISRDSAYYYHNLTDVIHKKIFMTTNRTSGRFNDEYIVQSYSIDNYFNLGKTCIRI